MSQFDILIVGGGPAGSSLAWTLRETGLSIAILDKSDFPRDKICAGWVTPEVMQELQIDLDDYAVGRTLQAINGFSVCQLGKKQIESLYPGGPVSYGIRRFEFDEYLLRRCGAELILGEKFESMIASESGWRVNDRYDAKLVIGAGGHFCPVARAVGAKTESSELVVAAKEIEFEMDARQLADCKIKAEVPELFFLPDLLGYGWVFRKGNYLNIGLGREDSHKLSSHVDAFVDLLKKQKKIPDDTPDKFSGHAYLLYPHAIRQIIKDGVMLIGDAAGLAYAQSGEGIRPAVESALLAARVIVECKGDYQANRIQQYTRLMEERFGERQPKPDLMEQLPQSIKLMLAGGLMQTRWFTRNVVMNKWFLQSHQSPLLEQVG